MKEEKNKVEKKTVKRGRCLIESDPEKEKRPSKIYKLVLYKETEEKEWKNRRIKPEKKKADKDNTLAYDLSKEPQKVEKTQKRKIVSPGKNKIERKGKKILVEKLKEDTRNTLAFH